MKYTEKGFSNTTQTIFQTPALSKMMDKSLRSTRLLLAIRADVVTPFDGIPRAWCNEYENKYIHDFTQYTAAAS
jgi:hypothetical protein